jgi:hypothetical protein
MKAVFRWARFRIRASPLSGPYIAFIARYMVHFAADITAVCGLFALISRCSAAVIRCFLPLFFGGKPIISDT